VKTLRRPTATASGSLLHRAPRHRAALLLVAVALLLSVGCASGGTPSARRSEEFPLDPREELPGPFPEGVETGWRALVAGDAEAAEREFLRARAASPHLAAEIGVIASRVLLGQVKEAVDACNKALTGPVTVPLLVACGEARARADQVFEAHELYARAAARSPGRPALKERAEQLEKQAIESLARSASAGAKDLNYADARRRIARAIEVSPGDAGLHALAGEIDLGAGEKDKAFERFREAYRLDPNNVPVQEKLAELALERDPALAVSVLDELSRRDPRYQDRAAAARLAFRISNWPPAERDIARSERLTRAGAATLVWWMFPEIREAKVSASIIASDAVSRRDSRAVLRAVSLGLLDVDRDTHRARPDAGLTRRTAARMLLRLSKLVQRGRELRCLEDSPGSGRSGAEAVRAAVRCGFLADEEGTSVGGQEFARGLDRVRVETTGKGGKP
jgi:tetratricopeptide (TPR) repeat protein